MREKCVRERTKPPAALSGPGSRKWRRTSQSSDQACELGCDGFDPARQAGDFPRGFVSVDHIAVGGPHEFRLGGLESQLGSLPVALRDRFFNGSNPRLDSVLRA